MKITIKNIFTFLKEKNIINAVKLRIAELIEENKDCVKIKIKSYIINKSPAMKDALVSFLISKIELPLIAKPFKGVIKKVIHKNLDKIEKFALEKLKGL